MLLYKSLYNSNVLLYNQKEAVMAYISPRTRERIERIKREDPKSYIKIIKKDPELERNVRTGGGGGGSSTATPIPQQTVSVIEEAKVPTSNVPAWEQKISIKGKTLEPPKTAPTEWTMKTYEIPRTVITRDEGTYAEFRGGDRFKISDETIGRPTSAWSLGDMRRREERLSPYSIKDVTPTTIKGRIWEGAKSAYLGSPFGASIPVDERYNVARGTGGSKWFNVLTPKESVSAIREEKLRKLRRDWKSEQIGKFNLAVEAAPEDKKYYTYERGRAVLKERGIYSTEEGDKLIFSAKEFKAPISKNVYDWERTKPGSLKRGVLIARIGSTKATEWYGISAGITGGIGAVAKVAPKGLTAYKSLGAVGKVFGTYSAPTGKSLKLLTGGTVAGLYGYGKTKQYSTLTTKAQKNVFWVESAGEVTGVGAFIGAKATDASRVNKIKQAAYQKKLARQDFLKNTEALSKSKRATLKYGQVTTQQSKRLSYNLYKQQLKIKTPKGMRGYTSSKRGWSKTFSDSGRTFEYGQQYRMYKGKPTSVSNILSSTKKGYTLTSYTTPKAKRFVYITKSVAGKGSETRLVRFDVTGKSYKNIWDTAGSTMKVSKYGTLGIKVSSTTGSTTISGGRGKPSLPSFNIGKPKTFKFKLPKKLDYSYLKDTKPPKFSGGSGKAASSGGLKLAQTGRTKPIAALKVKGVQSQINNWGFTFDKIKAPTKLSSGMAGGLISGGALGGRLISGRVYPRFRSGEITSFDSRGKVTPRPISSQRTGIGTVQISGGSSGFEGGSTTIIPPIPPTPNPPSPIDKVTKLGGGGFWLPSFAGFRAFGGTKKIKTKAKYGYTPSYTAVVKGIKGKRPKKKYYTGFELRPVTKNWMRRIFK